MNLYYYFANKITETQPKMKEYVVPKIYKIPSKVKNEYEKLGIRLTY